MARTDVPPRAGPLRPPRAGEPISARYLAQEFRLARSARADLVSPLILRAFAPEGGIPAPDTTGSSVQPEFVLCIPARWDGEKWVPDNDVPRVPIGNSFPEVNVPADAFLIALWEQDSHWEAITWSPC